MAKAKKEPIVSSGDFQNRLKLAIAQTDKQFGIGTVTILGKGSKPPSIARIDSGSHYLNDILGGGYPKGRIIEIFGPESSGKTTVSLHAIASAMREVPEKLVLFIDAEHALDLEYAQALGVDLERLVVAQPDTAEEALQIIELWMEMDLISMYVLDSVAALITKREIEGEIGDSFVGVLALLLSTTLKKIARLTQKTNTVGIFINQLREKIGVMFGSPETTTGGRALKFYSSVRLDIRPKELKKANGSEEPTSRETQIKIVKTKVSSPHRFVLVDIEFGRGISRSGEIVDIGQNLGIIEKSGAWYRYKDYSAQGREKMKALIEGNPELMEELDELVSVMMMPVVDEVIEPEEIIDIPEDYTGEDE